MHVNSHTYIHKHRNVQTLYSVGRLIFSLSGNHKGRCVCNSRSLGERSLLRMAMLHADPGFDKFVQECYSSVLGNPSPMTLDCN
jgi:hypothetical protein